jgi:Rieske Fe-S protein
LPIGTAKLTMNVPGSGELVLAKTRQVKGDEAAAAVGGASARTSQNEIKVKLAVKPRGKAKKKLNRKGKAKVKAKVTYTPDGSDPTIVGNTDTKKVKLIKR